MSKKDKLIERLKAKPYDFTLDEMDTLLSYFSFKRSNKGKTSGSRIIYISEFYSPIMLHKPHPNNTLKIYQIKQILFKLEQEGLI